MKLIISKHTNPKKNTVFHFDNNINSIFFYTVSLLLSIAVIVLMITAFRSVSVRASVLPEGKQPTVIIDAGHGGEDGGASANGVCEKDINLAIALKLNTLFQNSGINTIMTRNEDVALSDENIKTVKERKTSDIKNRAKIINSSSDNILISIHQNKFEQEKYSGTQIFYANKNTKSLLLAESIRKSVVFSLQPENTRETKPADGSIYILKNTENIAVLVECGFLSNKSESAKLNSEEYQQNLSQAIYNGFIEFINT